VTRILGLSGSLRAGSYNTALLRAGRELHPQVVRIASIADIPLYDADVESAGFPAPVEALKQEVAAADGVLLASPEYNNSVPGVLKNAIDWVSRATEEDEPPLKVLGGKTAAILAASPGGYGGSRGLDMLRKQLENIRIEVLENQVTVPKVHEVMKEDGSLKDEELSSKVLALGAELAGA